MLGFGEWRPDVSDLDTQFAREAKNVTPTANSYGPMKGLSAYTSNALATTALGLTIARETGSTWQIFAGTATKLWKFVGGDWSDYSRLAGGAYGVTAGNLWRFAQFGDTLIAVNPADVTQSITVTGGTAFAALAGSPPKGRDISIVGDFVVITQPDGAKSRIRWSAINDSTGWTTGTNLSDYQEFADGGEVNGVTGGSELAYVLQEYAIRTMRFVPGSASNAFEFDEVAHGIGCISPYGWAQRGASAYFIAEDGFYAVGPDGLRPIGEQKVNKWFTSRADLTAAGQIQAIADPVRPRILWAWRTPASTIFNRVLIYDIPLDRWTYGTIEAQIWGTSATPGTSLDSLGDIDALQYSLDSRIYEGGRPTLVAFDGSKLLSFLDGSNLEAVIETAEVHPIPGRRYMVQGGYPIVDASTATIRIGYRETLQSTVAYTASASLGIDGAAKRRATGRLLRYELTVPAGVTWTHAQGVEPFMPRENGLR